MNQHTGKAVGLGCAVGTSQYTAPSTGEPPKVMQLHADRALSAGFELEGIANRIGALRHRMGTHHFSDCPVEDVPDVEEKPYISEEYLPRMAYALDALDRQIERLQVRLNELESVG